MLNALQYGDITERVIGCAMKVHRHFGLGFPEAIYKRSLLIELDKNRLNYRSEVEKDIYYEGNFIGKRRLDLIIEEKVLIEIKAISDLDKTNYNQIINYLNIFDLEVGLLLNFGTESLQFKRFINNRRNQ
ncbi:MAG: GxxExxY protein [Chitinophagaceae bacterium]|nr:MAG: GxxExxY protein [Chitinophagaceae bacterium]